jgi:hypothetical protein
VFLDRARVHYQVIDKIEHETTLQVGEQFVDHPTQPLATHTDPHGEFVEFEQPKRGTKGSDSATLFTQGNLIISIIKVQYREYGSPSELVERLLDGGHRVGVENDLRINLAVIDDKPKTPSFFATRNAGLA